MQDGHRESHTSICIPLLVDFSGAQGWRVENARRDSVSMRCRLVRSALNGSARQNVGEGLQISYSSLVLQCPNKMLHTKRLWNDPGISQVFLAGSECNTLNNRPKASVSTEPKIV